jgi:multidrug resistance efflux pump
MRWKSLVRRRYAKWVALGVAAGLLAGGLWLQQALTSTTQIPVFYTIERGDVVNNVEATGTVDAVTTVNVGCQVSGMVNKILVDFNSQVKRGQVLATLEDSQYVSDVKQAEADLAAARAAVRVAEDTIETARADLDAARANLARDEALARQAALDYTRQESLFRQDIAAAADRDRLRTAAQSAQATAVASRALLQQAQARLANAQALLIQAQAQEKQRASALDLARTNLSYTVIRSPIEGTVVARNVDVGQTIAARLSAPNLFNIAQDLKHMYVYTKLDVRDVPKVQEGHLASFAVDAFPNRVWEGKVIQVRISPITGTKGQTTPSKLPTPASTTIPGLQTSSSSTSGPQGASTGSTATSATSVSAGAASASSGPGSSPAPGLVQYDALIEFRNEDRRLLPGMTAYVTIPVSAAYDVLRVRKEAFRSSPPVTAEEKNRLLRQNGIPAGEPLVWVEQGGRYRPATVKTGMTDYLFAEITSGAVKEGARVLIGYSEQKQ